MQDDINTPKKALGKQRALPPLRRKPWARRGEETRINGPETSLLPTPRVLQLQYLSTDPGIQVFFLIF